MTEFLRGIKPEHRRYLYRVANAALAVAVGYQLIDGDQSALWLLAINAVLGLADFNVPSQEA